MVRKTMRESMQALNNARGRQQPKFVTEFDGEVPYEVRAIADARAAARIFVDRPTQETFHCLKVELLNLVTLKVFD